MRLTRSLILIAALIAPLALPAQREKLPPQDLEFVEKTWPKAKKTTTGLRYVVLEQGSGPLVKAGNNVSVLYEGRTLDGKVFDKTPDREHPFMFRVAREQVIPGWDQILQLMHAGEKILVIIPPELAYGTRGKPPTIGRNATLVFEITLLEIRPD
jgi:FKBP-type peptidyl-prolyl cis-trans isomerase